MANLENLKKGKKFKKGLILKKSKLVGISFKRLQLKSLIETTGNPQKMTDAEFKGMVKSIKKDGWLLDAAVCWKRPDGKHQIISGHHRIRAAIEAGLIDADIKVIDGIDEAQARLLVLEANQRRGQFDTKAFDDFVNNIVNDFNFDIDELYDSIGLIDNKNEIDHGCQDIDEKIDNDNEYLKLQIAFKSIEDKKEFVEMLDKLAGMEKTISGKAKKFISDLINRISDESN